MPSLCFHFDYAHGSLSVLFGVDCFAVFDVLDIQKLMLNMICKFEQFAGPLNSVSNARWIAGRPPPREIIRTLKATSIFNTALHAIH
jgi:hypothetical protein